MGAYISLERTLSLLGAIFLLCACAACGGGGSKSSSQPITTTQSTTAGQLVANPSAVNFGSVVTGSSPSQTITLNNQGGSAVTVNGASVTGAGFSASALTTPLSLTPGQSSTVAITFSPSSAGAVSGQLSLNNTGSTSPFNVALSGTGVTAIAHNVDLSWAASTSAVTGYNIWRATALSGPFTRINSSLVIAGTYTDSTAMSGTVYYYAVTAVDTNGVESGFSNEAQASIPIP